MGNEIEALLPVLAAQKGILAESADGTGLYVGQQVIELTGPIVLDQLRVAWSEVGKRHQALRSGFQRHRASFFQVIWSEPETQVPTFDLTAFDPTEREHAAQALCEEELELGLDLGRGPLARLALFVMAEDRVRLSITHHHAGIDGRALSLVLDDLARLYDGDDLDAGHSTLVAVTRSLTHLDVRAVRVATDATGELNAFGLPGPGNVPETLRRPFRSSGIADAASSQGVTPASICISTWLSILAALRGSDTPVCGLSRDRRPSALRGADLVVGMLTETLLFAVPSFRPASPAAGASQVLDLLLTGDGPPTLADGLLQARRAGATGRPDTLLTVYASEILPDPPKGLAWRLLSAQETTEFAVDATVHLGAKPCLEVTYDLHRVRGEEMHELVERTVALLENPLRTIGVSGGGRAKRTRPEEVTGVGKLDLLVAVANRVLGRRIDPHEDLVAAGFDSLALLEVAVAMSETGVNVTVGDLVELGSVVRVGARAAARDATPRGDYYGPDLVDAPPSRIELGLLGLSRDASLGGEPLHEQSILAFDTRIDPQRLERAFRICLRRFPSLDRWWEAGSPDLLAPRGNRPADFESAPAHNEEPALDRARSLADDDLKRPFEPGCGALLRLRLVHSDRSSALLLAFHYAVLDGWSFGTVIRALQVAYSQPRGRRVIGTDSIGYRLRDARRAENPPPWRDWLNGVKPIRRPGRRPTLVRSGRAADALSRDVVRAAARECLASPASVVQAAAALALRRVLQWPPERTVALRMSVRDGLAGAGMRAVGQLTADVPLPLASPTLAEVTKSIVGTRLMCLDAGFLGHEDFRNALGCAGDEVVTDTSVVVEHYFRLDEIVARQADQTAWPEASTWRRDMSPAWRTVTLDDRDGSWSLELRTVLDEDPSDLARRLSAEMACVLASGASDRSLRGGVPD